MTSYLLDHMELHAMNCVQYQIQLGIARYYANTNQTVKAIHATAELDILQNTRAASLRVTENIMNREMVEIYEKA